jgi:hypothetical protein
MSTDTALAEHPRKRGERTDSSIKKLPNGKGWRARPTLGTDPVTGRQVRPTKVFATKKAAQDWVTEQRQQWSTATWAPKSTRTFDEVADHWMMLREADPSLGPNTVRADRESLAYARRAFGALPVQKLTPAALAGWSAKLTGKGGAPLAPATNAARSSDSSRSWRTRARCAGLPMTPRPISNHPNRRQSPPPQPMTSGPPSR